MQQGQQTSPRNPSGRAASQRPMMTSENAQWQAGPSSVGLAYQVGPQMLHPQAYTQYLADGYAQPQHSQDFAPYLVAYPQQAGWYQMPAPGYQQVYPQPSYYYVATPQQHSQMYMPDTRLHPAQQPAPQSGRQSAYQNARQTAHQQVQQPVQQNGRPLHVRSPASQQNGWPHSQAWQPHATSQPAEALQRQEQRRPSRTSSGQLTASDSITQALEATSLNGPPGTRNSRAAAAQNGNAVRANPSIRRVQSSKTGAPQVFALDVECVATGTGCQDRAVAQIAVLDEQRRVVLDLYVRPDEPITSYLTDLTGLTRDILDTNGVSFATAMQTFHSVLPSDAVLMSYNIDTDLKWLNLEYKIDREEVRDLKGCYQQDPKTGRYTRRVWGQDHLARCLLGEVADRHDAVGDALKSMRLWQLYNTLKADPEEHAKALDLADSTPKKPSFAVRHPTYEGVCMGNRRTCTCGQNVPPGPQKQHMPAQHPPKEGPPQSGTGAFLSGPVADGKSRPPALLIPRTSS